MSASVSADPAAVVSVCVYLHTHEHGRRLPVSRQQWRYYVRLADQSVQDLPVPAEFMRDADYQSDLVVLCCELHGVFIDESAVINDWPAHVSRWQRGS